MKVGCAGGRKIHQKDTDVKNRWNYSNSTRFKYLCESDLALKFPGQSAPTPSQVTVPVKSTQGTVGERENYIYEYYLV